MATPKYPNLMQPVTVTMYAEPDVPIIVVVGAADFIAWQRRTGNPDSGALMSNPFDMEGWAFVAYRALCRERKITDLSDEAFNAWIEGVGSVLIGDAIEAAREEAEAKARAEAEETDGTTGGDDAAVPQ